MYPGWGRHIVSEDEGSGKVLIFPNPEIGGDIVYIVQ